MSTPTLFSRFSDSLREGEVIARLAAGLIGDGVMLDGPLGPHPMVYADYVASGRALRQIEDLMMTEVLPYYANSHTEGSYCGAAMTNARRDARAVIAEACGADARHAVVFCGAGATAGLNRVVALLGVPEAVAAGARPLILIGPYEHHSNILPWRESGAEVVEIPEAAEGGVDMEALRAALLAGQGRMIVGSFSAMSNVSGIVSDVDAVSRLLNRHGARVVWDYAGGGPYLPIDMAAGTPAQKDAVVTSPHKFVGGPGASGVMILRKAAVTRDRPTVPGGGTVRFVSPWGHDYLPDLAAREEAGTPDVLGDIRAGLVFAVKSAITTDLMARRHAELRARALAAWADTPAIRVMGNPRAREVLPVFSFRIEAADGSAILHQQLVTRILSDCFGIQSRAGCACAGPYGHRLLDIGKDRSDAMRSQILAGDDLLKPGFTRLNLSVLMDDAKVAKIIGAVREIARNPARYQQLYTYDAALRDFRLAGPMAA
jgi:selenocysteine lyase/cysteine desulfurase